MTTPRRRLAHASFWTMAGTSVQLGAGMLGSIGAARLLGAVRFGELAITRTTLLTFTLLSGANLGVAASRAIAELRRTDAERAGRVLGVLFDLSLIVSLVAALLCLVLAAPITRQLGMPHLTAVFALIAPAVLFASMGAVQIGALNGFEAFAVGGWLLAAEGVLTAALLVGGAYADHVRGAVFGMILAAAAAYILRRRALAAICRAHGIVVRRGQRMTAELPLLRTLVLPSALFGLGTQPFAWLARALLARGPDGLAAVGVFSAAYSWGAAVLMVPTQITRPSMPILTSLLAQGETANFKRLLRDMLLIAFGAGLLIALPVVVFARWIMGAYGSRFASGALVLCLLALSSVLASLSAALRSALVASGDAWGQVLQSLLWGCALITTFFLARRHGALALGIAYNVAFFVTLVSQAWIAAVMLKTGRRIRAAVNLSDPAVAETTALFEEPKA